MEWKLLNDQVTIYDSCKANTNNFTSQFPPNPTRSMSDFGEDHEYSLGDISCVSPKCRISRQEQNCGPEEEPPTSTNHHEKSLLRQYLVDKPDGELRRILRVITSNNGWLRIPEFMDEK
jgi:hypothetical protein